MAFDYFSKLPIIEYPLNSETNKKARDILHRIFLDQKFADMSVYIKKYQVQDGDRPEIISAKLYNRSDLHSIIMLLNNENDVLLSGLPPTSYIYQDYINAKYYDDVYYLYPMDSFTLSATGSGLTGGYIFPIFGKGFHTGEKIFAVDSFGFPVVETRAYVKDWNPKESSLKLDVLSGIFSAGITIGNSTGNMQFMIGHKKKGAAALHHFEAINDTFVGTTPLIKGSIIDPVADITTSSGGIKLSPIGLTSAGTGAYDNTLSYQYAKNAVVPQAFTAFIKVVTNQDYEDEMQNRKRYIFVPEKSMSLLSTTIETITELIKVTP